MKKYLVFLIFSLTGLFSTKPSFPPMHNHDLFIAVALYETGKISAHTFFDLFYQAPDELKTRCDWMGVIIGKNNTRPSRGHSPLSYFFHHDPPELPVYDYPPPISYRDEGYSEN